jgi:hypothetical protein
MKSIEIMVPELLDELPPADLHLAERRSFPENGRLTLIDNGKPKAKEIMQFIADGLRQRFSIGEVTIFSKGAASRIIDEDEVRLIASTSDAVITGLGDCGACSACSLGDAIKMEGAGIPSTVVISDVFVSHIASFAVTMGLPGYHSAVVPHPVSSKSDEQLALYAEAVVDQVALQLTGLRTADVARVA